MKSQLYQRIRQWIIFWLARRLPTCKEVTRLMSDSLDRRLSLRQRIEVKWHLLICTWCERYKRQLLFIREALRYSLAPVEDKESPPTTSLPPAARERIKRVLINKGP